MNPPPDNERNVVSTIPYRNSFVVVFDDGKCYLWNPQAEYIRGDWEVRGAGNFWIEFPKLP